MSWKFKGNIVTEENTPEGAVGFVILGGGREGGESSYNLLD